MNIWAPPSSLDTEGGGHDLFARQQVIVARGAGHVHCGESIGIAPLDRARRSDGRPLAPAGVESPDHLDGEQVVARV
jgi:hypothetical protein